MGQFKNANESHSHSRLILDVLYGYDSFLDSLETIADFGCGIGLDALWWAKLETRDEPPEPRNYRVFAVDKNLDNLLPEVKQQKNIHTIQEDFDTQYKVLPIPADLIWTHNSFQYVTNPINTLKLWNEQLNVNGMLVLSIPQNISYEYNRLKNISPNYSYFNYNLVNLTYLLAVNGFDCADAYFYVKENDPWLFAAVYKSDIEPMNPKTTSWYQLAELNLINSSFVESLNRWGYVKQEDIVMRWLDKDFNQIKQ